MRSLVRPPSHRRRFVIGLACALFFGVGVGLALLIAARTAERHQLAAREAVVTLSALSDLIGRAETPAAEPAAPQEPAQEQGGMGLGDELAALEPGAETAQPEPGEAVRRAVARFAAAHPELRSEEHTSELQ